MSVEKEEFEKEIEKNLIEHGGYVKGKNENYNKRYALDSSVLCRFIKESQPKEWNKIIAKYGEQNAEESILKRINKSIDEKDMMYVLRKGILDLPAKIKLCYFEPISKMNKTDADNYEKNILTIVRGLKYSDKSEQKIDTLLFINGLPIATLEINDNKKGKTVEEAKQKYKDERDPRDLLLGFRKRCLVHFAIDKNEVYMTTKLDGENTSFLAFNKGNKGGKGNPKEAGKIKTSYLWEDILRKDSLMDIVQKFIHIQKKRNDKGKAKEEMLFPRYHQLDVVRKITDEVRKNGTGHNYLIQHSAGSGKSNSISWLAHRLQNLHGLDNRIIFNSVIVVTDRIILDKQLQDTIYQFEHIDGVVVKIDANSTQLADALNTGKKIIITTIQKFSFIMEKVKDLSTKKFAVIIDEAHSSQTGSSARNLKSIIGDKNAGYTEDEYEIDSEDAIIKEMQKFKTFKNLSFFAFTATPKEKTVQIFGTRDKKGNIKAFHLYSLQQAIEEGFILNVQKNYIEYEKYKDINESIEKYGYKNIKANKAIQKAKEALTLQQKVEIIIEHIRNITIEKIMGKAKILVVTSTRINTIRYYFELQKYIKDNGYEDEIGVLVAFAGTITYGGIKYSESIINQISETDLPRKFKTNSYQILVAAEKYQTGFDEPYLHTMFVDKVLSHIKAVQTLSRLNRTCYGKEDTFVLDFINTTSDIKTAFAPHYYEATFNQITSEEITDVNQLYILKQELEKNDVYTQTELNSLAKVFFKPTRKQGHLDLKMLDIYIEKTINRYKRKNQEVKNQIKINIKRFINIYAFISNIVRIDDVELHKLFVYSKVMQKKILKKDTSSNSYTDYEIMLQFYRMQKIYESSINVEREELLYNINSRNKSKAEQNISPISELVEKINDKFNTGLINEAVIIDQIIEDMENDKDLCIQAKNNSKERFKFPFNDAFISIVVDRMEQNQAFCEMVLDNEKYSEMLKNLLLEYAYERLRTRANKY